MKLSLITVGALTAALISAPTASAEAFNLCPSGLTAVATEDTSCAFADNVRAAWIAQPGAAVTAFSPVTQQSYAMQCAPTATSPWPAAQRCVGVNFYGAGLVVFIATASGSGGQVGIIPGQINGPVPYVGIDADSPNLPNVNGPNIGCTWVNGYTKKNGTHVSGYWRC